MTASLMPVVMVRRLNFNYNNIDMLSEEFSESKRKDNLYENDRLFT